VLLEIGNYCRAGSFPVTIFQFLWLNHHLAVASAKFAKDPAIQQAHGYRSFCLVGSGKSRRSNPLPCADGMGFPEDFLWKYLALQ
jgi:hypothetical protein